MQRTISRLVASRLVASKSAASRSAASKPAVGSVAMTGAAVSTLYADLVTATRALGWADSAEPVRAGQWLRPQWEAQVLVYCLLHERIVGEAAEQSVQQADGLTPRAFAQSVFDLMTYDWDQTLRVRGSGDAKTVRLMRHLGQGFYGRMQGYQEAVAQDSHQARERALAEMLARTLFADSVDDDSIAESARRVGREVLALREALRLRDVAEVWAGVCLTAAVRSMGVARQEAEAKSEPKAEARAKPESERGVA